MVSRWSGPRAVILVAVALGLGQEAFANSNFNLIFGRRPAEIAGFDGRNTRVVTTFNDPRLVEINAQVVKLNGTKEFAVNGNGTTNALVRCPNGLVIRPNLFDVVNIGIPARCGTGAREAFRDFLGRNLGNIRNQSGNNALQLAAAASIRGGGNFRTLRGFLTLDLKGAVPKDETLRGKGKLQQRKMAVAAVNFFLNSLSRCARHIKVPEPAVSEAGLVKLDLARLRDNRGVQCFGADQLALFSQSDASSRCTGAVRFENLMAFNMEPTIYQRHVNPNNLNMDQLLFRSGCEPDQFRTRNNILLVAGKESGVASAKSGTFRLVRATASRRLLGACQITSDFNERRAPGADSTGSDVRESGIFAKATGFEFFTKQDNGFRIGLGANAQKTVVDYVPGQIAAAGHTGQNPTIASSIISCARCHDEGERKGSDSCKAGSIAGGYKCRTSPNEKYSEQRQNILNGIGKQTLFGIRNEFGQPLKQQDYFTTNESYRKRYANPDNAFLARVENNAGARYYDDQGKLVSVLPEMYEKYYQNLKPVDMARSQGVSLAQFQARFPNLKDVPRSEWEGKNGSGYCGVRQALAAGGGAPQVALKSNSGGPSGSPGIRSFQDPLGAQHNN